jgi:RimJ/RimL family protein N-acetyltransferase
MRYLVTPMQKILHTSRLTLRPCEATDIALLHHHWTEPAVRRYLWDGRIIGREKAQEVVYASLESFSRHGYGLWILLSKTDSTFRGVCGLRDGTREWPELLYSVPPQYWGFGIATESARGMLHHVFQELGLTYVVATVDKPNVGSIRVLEKIGFSVTGEKYMHGNPIVCYAISQERFREWDIANSST